MCGKKPTHCKFCKKDVTTKNFTRHLIRHHILEPEVKKILEMPKSSKERRQAFCLLRNDTNFDLFIKGDTRPLRTNSLESKEYYPCAYCKGLFYKHYLRRHAKSCYLQKQTKTNKENQIYQATQSQTIVACATDPTDVLSKLSIKEKVSGF